MRYDKWGKGLNIFVLFVWIQNLFLRIDIFIQSCIHLFIYSLIQRKLFAVYRDMLWQNMFNL